MPVLVADAGETTVERFVEFFTVSIRNPATVAVGTGLSSEGSARPPHRSQRAALPHWAPTSGDDAKSLQGIGMEDAGGR